MWRLRRVLRNPGVRCCENSNSNLTWHGPQSRTLVIDNGGVSPTRHAETRDEVTESRRRSCLCCEGPLIIAHTIRKPQGEAILEISRSGNISRYDSTL